MQEKENRSNDNQINLLRLVQVLLKRLWIIVLVAVLFGAGAYIYSIKMIAPSYRTSFTTYINNRGTFEGLINMSAGDVNASIALSRLYAEIITSRSVQNDATARCQQYGGGGSVSTSVSEYTALITVYVTASTPEIALEYAEAVAEVAPTHVARVVEGGSMRILDAPTKPSSPYTPNHTKNAMTGAVIGGALVAVIIVLIDLISDYVQSSDDLEQRYQLPVIGSIPDIDSADKSRYGYVYRSTGGRKK